MPIPLKFIADFEEYGIYHIYNRTNNKEALFLSDENRIYFLKRFKEILSPFIDTYCWCLLDNHFHFLIKVKAQKDIIEYLKNKETQNLTKTERAFFDSNLSDGLPTFGRLATLSPLIEQTFKRFFQSYALAYNNQHKRNGNLFYKPFKRVLIEKDSQFTMALIYIHANVVKHGLIKDFTKYKWSSWSSIISNKPTQLLRDEVIDWFGDLKNCIKTHIELASHYYNCEIGIEEDD